MKPVFAIVVTYKRTDCFKRTLESLVSSLPPQSHLRVIDNEPMEQPLVDVFGGTTISSDSITSFHSPAMAAFHETTYPNYTITKEFIGVTKNGGWGAAMNIALDPKAHEDYKNGVFVDWCDYEYVLESNNDVVYDPDWYLRARVAMEAHPEIGILGGFKHPYHGVRKALPDGVIVKDDMPACAWLMRSKDLKEFLPFPEHGACKTRGGNGEDVAFRDKVQNKLGRWICGTEEDWAHHIDGYDIPDLGKPNPAYD